MVSRLMAADVVQLRNKSNAFSFPPSKAANRDTTIGSILSVFIRVYPWLNKMTNRIEIYDTTLRDGTQGEAINFSVADKCRSAEELHALGVDFIEGGWPGSNPR